MGISKPPMPSNCLGLISRNNEKLKLQWPTESKRATQKDEISGEKVNVGIVLLLLCSFPFLALFDLRMYFVNAMLMYKHVNR